MNVLIACEFSGIVRDAFKAQGHNAFSCDFLDTESPGLHLKGNVLAFLNGSWDLMIGHPDCTYLAVSGARWFKFRQQQQIDALNFFRTLLESPIPKICLENPISVVSTHIRKPDQIIQPYYFGHPEKKTTCLWLKNLPQLVPTKILSPPYKETLWRTPPQPDRWKIRSRTFTGIAKAMATQWG
jgi:hypothetical protein